MVIAEGSAVFNPQEILSMGKIKVAVMSVMALVASRL
jgi:hypothetical protein